MYHDTQGICIENEVALSQTGAATFTAGLHKKQHVEQQCLGSLVHSGSQRREVLISQRQNLSQLGKKLKYHIFLFKDKQWKSL